MSTLAVLLLGTLAYGAILCAGILLSQPARTRLEELADEMLAETGRSRGERDQLEWMVSTSMATVVGLMVPFAAVFTLAAVSLGARPRIPANLQKLHSDPRYEKIVHSYMISIMACSPIAALVATPVILASMLVAALHDRRSVLFTAEVPVMRASAAFQTC